MRVEEEEVEEAVDSSTSLSMYSIVAEQGTRFGSGPSECEYLFFFFLVVQSAEHFTVLQQ